MNTSSNLQTIVLGGGCFWCLEASFELIAGIEAAEPGYAGGERPNPSYELVCGGTTGHAEVVRVRFNPDIITLKEVLEVFWTIHDPTTLNRQGHDVGSQYRSIILYENEAQRQVAAASMAETAKLWPDRIVTELMELAAFYPAEAVHRHYFERHPEQAYCQVVINPKLQKLRQRFTSRLKA